jgi:hypothetical protein
MLKLLLLAFSEGLVNLSIFKNKCCRHSRSFPRALRLFLIYGLQSFLTSLQLFLRAFSIRYWEQRGKKNVRNNFKDITKQYQRTIQYEHVYYYLYSARILIHNCAVNSSKESIKMDEIKVNVFSWKA